MLKITIGDPEAAHVDLSVDAKPEGVAIENGSNGLDLDFGCGALTIHGLAALRWLPDAPSTLDSDMPFMKTGEDALTINLARMKRDGFRWLELTEGGAIKGHKEARALVEPLPLYKPRPYAPKWGKAKKMFVGLDSKSPKANKVRAVAKRWKAKRTKRKR